MSIEKIQYVSVQEIQNSFFTKYFFLLTSVQYVLYYPHNPRARLKG